MKDADKRMDAYEHSTHTRLSRMKGPPWCDPDS
jgi:hypothetical protein